MRLAGRPNGLLALMTPDLIRCRASLGIEVPSSGVVGQADHRRLPGYHAFKSLGLGAKVTLVHAGMASHGPGLELVVNR